MRTVTAEMGSSREPGSEKGKQRTKQQNETSRRVMILWAVYKNKTAEKSKVRKNPTPQTTHTILFRVNSPAEVHLLAGHHPFLIPPSLIHTHVLQLPFWHVPPIP